MSEPRQWRVPLQVLDFYEMPPNPEFVDVIERSAFDALKTKCEEAIAENEAMKSKLRLRVGQLEHRIQFVGRENETYRNRLINQSEYQQFLEQLIREAREFMKTGELRKDWLARAAKVRE